MNARLVFTVLFINQVCGAPTFYWSQPDCYPQGNDGSYNSYDSYQGPSYQETLQAMMDETIRAICDIIRVTAKAMKQELAAISQSIYENIQSEDCNTTGYVYDPPTDNQFNEGPVQVMSSVRPMDSEHIDPGKPQSPAGMDLPSTTDNTKTTSSETPIILDVRIGSEHDTTPLTIPVSQNNQRLDVSTAEATTSKKTTVDHIATSVSSSVDINKYPPASTTPGIISNTASSEPTTDKSPTVITPNKSTSVAAQIQQIQTVTNSVAESTAAATGGLNVKSSTDYSTKTNLSTTGLQSNISSIQDELVTLNLMALFADMTTGGDLTTVEATTKATRKSKL